MVGKSKALRLVEDTYNLQQKVEFTRKKKDFVQRKQKILNAQKDSRHNSSNSLESNLIQNNVTNQ